MRSSMRRIAWMMLLLFVFTIPWEYSLDLGGLLGNAARIAGLLVLLAAVPAVLQAGRMRTPGAFWALTLALFLWFCCSYFWTIDPTATLEKSRGFFQEMMIVWLMWEFVDTPGDLRSLLRATVAGSWVLALLTLAAFSSPEAIATGQIRFAAFGQDPNEVARFLDLGFPLAALLVNCERRWPPRLLALGFFPLGIFAVVLTASREGLLAAVIGLSGSLVLLIGSRTRRIAFAAFALPPFLAALWLIVPSGTSGATCHHPRAAPNRRSESTPQHLVRRLACLRAGANSWHGSRLIRRRLTSIAHRHGAQHGALHRRERRPVRFVPGSGPRCARCSLCSADPGLSTSRAHYFAAGLDSHLARRHGGREPNHMVAPGHHCGGRPSCIRRSQWARRVFLRAPAASISCFCHDF